MKVGSRKSLYAIEALVLFAVGSVVFATVYSLYRIGSQSDESRKQLLELRERQFVSEYTNLAGHLETRIPQLDEGFSNIVRLHKELTDLASSPDSLEAKQTGLEGLEAKRKELEKTRNIFGRRSDSFDKWIDRQILRTEERGQNQNLKQLIGKGWPSSLEASTNAPIDLESLLTKVNTAYENYLVIALEAVTNSPTQEGFEESVRIRDDLLGLARRARDSGTEIDEFLKAQALPPPLSWVVPYLLLGGCAVLLIFLPLGFRYIETIHYRVELARRDAQIEHQQQLTHFSQLAASLAHEIRNPLTAISSRLYTLQDALAKGTSEFVDSAVIGDEIRRLDRIVQDFLALARPGEPKLVPMSADPLLHKLCDFLAPQYEAKSIKLKVDSVVVARFRADEQQLRQVLINLIRNAAESMEKGGMITLRARQDKVRLRDCDSEVVMLEVEDTGSGIPLEVQERLFTPFFSTKEGGTGLGLSIASGIVDKHGGTLEFKSEMGKGTTFRIILPLAV